MADIDDYLVADIDYETSTEKVVATPSADEFSSALTTNGEYLVGVVPKREIDLATASTMKQLVESSSASLLFIDSRNIEIVQLQDSASQLPIAPGLTTHMTV